MIPTIAPSQRRSSDDSEPASRRLLRPARLTAAISEQLRTLIIAGSLAPGSQLRQRELAEHLRVSRTPLREALQVLEQEGLVTTGPTGSWQVSALTPESLRECMAAREVLDGLVARLASDRGLPEQLRSELRALLQTMEAALGSGQPQEHQLAAVNFHLLLMAGLQNRWLDQFATLVRLSAAATFQRLRHHPAELTRAVMRLSRVLDAIETGDSDAAEMAARKHARTLLAHWETG